MKGKKLKKIIKEIDDSVDVKMYHPAVDDWVDFELLDVYMYRMKKDYLLELINLQNKQRGVDKIVTECREPKWELYEYDSIDEDEKEGYEFKKIKLIANKTKGESTFDRLGTINY